jgi:hypothetical protein
MQKINKNAGATKEIQYRVGDAVGKKRKPAALSRRV